MKIALCSLVATLCVAPSLSAAVVNADFSRDISVNNFGTNPAPVLYTGTGPASDLGTVWNDIQVPLTQTGTTNGTIVVDEPELFENLTDSSGAATAIDLEFTSGFYRSFNSTAAPAAGTHTALQSDRIFPNGGDLATLTIKGLDTGKTYDIYLITSAFGTEFTIGTTSQIADASSDGDGTWTVGQDYVLFSGVSSDLAGEIAVGIQDGDGEVTGFGVISGLQIVEVPEPGSLALLGLGGLAMIARRRRD